MKTISTIEELRKEMMDNRLLRIEFLGDFSKLLRSHELQITPKLLSEIQLAVTNEIPKDQKATSIDPGPHPDPAIDPK